MRVVGLMSGTSMDGVDAALVETDGEAHVQPLGFVARPYAEEERAAIRAAVAAALSLSRPGSHPAVEAASRTLTLAHARAVKELLDGGTADLVGFHGQTVAHRPDRGWTWQIGQPDLLAQMTGMPVMFDFRSADVVAGGQGAPLAPGFHRALAHRLAKPLGVLNLGGVGNLTWFAADGRWGSFDTGPGNALIDDWVREHTGRSHDAGGDVAARGSVRDDVIDLMTDLDWFEQAGAKSLDRHDFTLGAVRGLSLEDGAATLTALTAETVRLALRHAAERPARLLVTGGGRHNATLMRMIAERCDVPTEPVEVVGWNGDALEAQAFAWLAARALDGRPTSWPESTGVAAPVSGGVLYRPPIAGAGAGAARRRSR